MYGQTFDQQDFATIALLIVLEGVLSIDNALVLALLAKRLAKAQQAKALTYGLIGAFAFRFFAIGGASYLLKWEIVKVVGGGYLIWVALAHLLSRGSHDQEPGKGDAQQAGVSPKTRDGTGRFWPTVLVIELTDIAFAIDSILAAIAVVGSAPAGHEGAHPKLWVVMTGGMLGVLLMRAAATFFIRLLERFPRFETSAYLLVFVIGIKLLADWGFNSAKDPHRVNFHDPSSLAFWTFWVTMGICIVYGFLPSKENLTAEVER